MDSTEQQSAAASVFALEMFGKYRAALKQYFLYHVVDEGRLPLDKQGLKAVIKLLMFQQWGDEEKAALRYAYSCLSKFQPGAETLERMQQMNMEIYEECLERDGVELSEEERLAHLAFSSKGSLEEADLEVVDSEKQMLETELAHWELMKTIEEQKQEKKQRREEAQQELERAWEEFKNAVKRTRGKK